ncbi:NADH:flavin oxidoreductase [Temperatibacter marinus]|uniref:NADH:flavin oxidoreductase n=1 Tax=Temperatibacter marinus TaxID=1456591 RepID=A0AA52H9M9_9PROT|nr:NADH:flavin oxidoreductase [Temperatibacter marinus]WND03084.1 NADH:flavin oxidoreductase [Temperatibacter marinus]
MTNSLFTPFDLGTLTLANRIVMAPMTRSYSPGNVPNDLNVEYYRKRAAGGVGLIITEGTCVGHPAASGYPNVPFFYGKEALAGWKKVVEAVHAEGGKIAPQLWHVGAIRKVGSEPDPEVPGYGPSGLVAPGKKRCHEMSVEDIQECIDAFVEGGIQAKTLGFDGVEIHGAHGYLVDQFFSEELNIRTDEWGGSMENRSRFAVEIIKGIREKCGPEFPIIFRFSQWKQHSYDAKLAKNPEELAQFLEPLVDAGVDIFHASTRRFWEPEFEGSDLNLAGWTQKLTGIPTITVGSVGLDSDFLTAFNPKADGSAPPQDISTLVQRMDNTEFDLVAVGRALIANPEWANMVRDGLEEDLKTFDREMLTQLV